MFHQNMILTCQTVICRRNLEDCSVELLCQMKEGNIMQLCTVYLE
jgi:hypothetical protein